MKVILTYKNFAANRNISHIGLGVAALNNMKSLVKSGVSTLVWPITSATDLRAKLLQEPDTTHVNISAPWIPSAEMQRMLNDFPRVTFSMTCHSNVGFLQADSNGVRLFREAMEIERATHNFHVSGNCQRFVQWARASYGVPCVWLPNMYYLDGSTNVHRPAWQSGRLRIGVFGATRPLKNFMSAAGAALEIAQSLRADLEIWMNSGRTEGGGDTILNSITEMLKGVPFVKMVQAGWQTWPQFRNTVAHMHLLLQPSYTESFNMVTADGIAGGVPSVVGDAIDWCPSHWQAKTDDVQDIARVGRQLLRDHSAAVEGLRALETHNASALAAWRSYLKL
jgi:hypothetical protein